MPEVSVIESPSTSKLTTRLLPPEEWHRLANFGHYESCGLPNPEYTTIIVVEVEGEIVACWQAMDKIWLEGLFVASEHRKKVNVAANLFFGMMQLLQARGVQQAMTLTQDEAVAHMADTAGFVRVPGTIHVLTLKPPSVAKYVAAEDLSAQPCGCDLGANWICERHR